MTTKRGRENKEGPVEHTRKDEEKPERKLRLVVPDTQYMWVPPPRLAGPPVCRLAEPPMLLQIFLASGRSDLLARDFDDVDSLPDDHGVRLYAWRDTTMRELVQCVVVELRRRELELKVADLKRRQRTHAAEATATKDDDKDRGDRDKDRHRDRDRGRDTRHRRERSRSRSRTPDRHRRHDRKDSRHEDSAKFTEDDEAMLAEAMKLLDALPTAVAARRDMRGIDHLYRELEAEKGRFFNRVKFQHVFPGSGNRARMEWLAPKGPSDLASSELPLRFSPSAATGPDSLYRPKQLDRMCIAELMDGERKFLRGDFLVLNFD